MKVLIGPNAFGLERCIEELAPMYPDITFEFCKEPAELKDAIADADVYMGWMNRDIYLAAGKVCVEPGKQQAWLFACDPGQVQQARSRGAHGNAGAAQDASVTGLLKGRAYLALGAAPGKGDGFGLADLAAGAHAQSAKHAVVGWLCFKPARSRAQLARHVNNSLGVGA